MTPFGLTNMGVYVGGNVKLRDKCQCKWWRPMSYSISFNFLVQRVVFDCQVNVLKIYFDPFTILCKIYVMIYASHGHMQQQMNIDIY